MRIAAGILLSAFLLFIFFYGKSSSAIAHDAEPDSVRSTAAFPRVDTTLRIQRTQEGELTIYRIDRFNTIVVRIPRITSYLYMQSPQQSLEQIAKDSNYSLVVNGSYFDLPSDRPGFKHAGFLKINGVICEGMKEDRQIACLLAFSSKSNAVGYFGITELDKTEDYDLVVQTGPQIIRNNEIDTACIDRSINGNSPRIRTAFASVDEREFYVIVSLGNGDGSGGVSLNDLGTMLRSSGIFNKTLDIINFDGGPSTSLYIKNHPELSWRTSNVLPLLLCVK